MANTNMIAFPFFINLLFNKLLLVSVHDINKSAFTFKSAFTLQYSLVCKDTCCDIEAFTQKHLGCNKYDTHAEVYISTAVFSVL